MREFYWSPIAGCTKVSLGCDNCAPFINPCLVGVESVVTAGEWNGSIEFIEDVLTQPFSPQYRSGVLVWTAQLGDLWHPSVTDEMRLRVLGVIAKSQARFIVTTRRPAEMKAWMEAPGLQAQVLEAAEEFDVAGRPARQQWPLPNLILGVGVENQAVAAVAIPLLAATPAATRVVWAAPILGDLDLNAWVSDIDWVVVRAEEGDDRRAPTPSWVVDLKDWCVEEEIPFYFRGWGEDITDETEEPLLSAACGDLEKVPKNARSRVSGRSWTQVPA